MSIRPDHPKYKEPQELFEIGARFGELEIIDIRDSGRWRKSYLCKCSCGETKVIGHSRLAPRKNRGSDRSCGCKEKSRGGIIKSTSDKRVYNIWYEMNKRCHNPTADNYERYGGSGVKVSDEWREDFNSFYEWAKTNGYNDELTIDRIDNDKPYSPSNCRWVNFYTQAQNKGILKSNKTGVTGVSEYKYGYKVNIMRNGIRLDLGTCKTLKEATEARLRAEEYFKRHKTLEGYKT